MLSQATPIVRRYEEIKAGAIIWTHCSQCMERTDNLVKNTEHLFTGTGKGLICLVCHPECDPRKKESENVST